jgi:adenine-specific DNA-methyltransferase
MQIDIKHSLKKAYRKQRPTRAEIELLKLELENLLKEANPKESEEYHKGLLRDFLKKTAYSDYFINTKDRSDLVIHNGKDSKSSVGVIIETKRPGNKTEMPTIDNLNKKATQELLLYFLRERISNKNNEIKYLIATNLYEWFIFDATEFERFAEDKKLKRAFINFEQKRLSSEKTELFYKEIASPAIEQVKDKIKFTPFNIHDYVKYLKESTKADESKLVELQKILSPTHLLKLTFANDSNTLNKEFYNELLHIIGLEEYKEKSKKLIRRKIKENRNEGSLIEGAITQITSLDKLSQIKGIERFGDNPDERLFNIGLELVMTWINRILFLKLLESQIVGYHNSKDYVFLNKEKVSGYDDLDTLFFKVLAVERKNREKGIKEKFPNVPYLNSSLFDPTDLEKQTVFISNLPNNITLPLYKKTVVKNGEKLNTLEYLLKFLDAYDFSSEGEENIAEDNKTLINASVLGLIFEKINGYKDGSYFTPGFITMYMCRETIRRAVVQKFKEQTNFNSDKFGDLVNFTSGSYKKEELKKYNEIINSLKICDPAVGSGHFLVSALNEIIAIKAELGILSDENGKPLRDYLFDVENDELMILDRNGEFFKYDSHNRESCRIQKTLFHEKQTIIENCLFGVDINPNSVNICRLRLWIELLKNAYYKENGELETLPNIDINIKCGNSLVSRYPLNADLGHALVGSTWDIGTYRLAVMNYRNAVNKEQKREAGNLINKIKDDFHTGITENEPIRKKRKKIKEELIDLTAQGRLFNKNDFKTDKNVVKRIETLTKDIAKLDTEIEALNSGALYRNAFEWRFEFPEVLHEKTGNFLGFDIMVANPPYKMMPKGILEQYKSANKNNNIYAAFVELGVCLLAEKGNMIYIIPTTWMAGNNFYDMRHKLLDDNLINKIVQLPYDIFDEPYVDSLILGLSKEPSNYVKTFKFNIRDNVNVEHNYSDFDSRIWKRDKDNVIFLEPHLIGVLEKYKNIKSFKLGGIAEIQRGTLPPKQNEVFQTKDSGRISWFNHQVHRYQISYEDEQLYVNPDTLREGKPIELFLAEKILGRQLISRQFRLQFVYCNEPYAFKKNLYAIYNLNTSVCDYYFLLAILNSRYYSFIQVGLNASGQRDDYPSFS